MPSKQCVAPDIDLLSMEDEVSRLPTRSVRFRVTVIATVIVAIVLTVVAVAIVIVQHRALTSAIDESLERRADDL